MTTPCSTALRFLRQEAGLSQLEVARLAGVTQPRVTQWESDTGGSPAPVYWDKVEAALTLGKRKGRERVKWGLVADLGGGHLKYMYLQNGVLPVWLDREVAATSAYTLRAVSNGTIAAYALPMYADYAAQVAVESGTGEWFAADDGEARSGIQAWFASRARTLDLLASLMRQFTAVAAEQQAVPV